MAVDLSAQATARRHVVHVLGWNAFADDVLEIAEVLVSEVVTNVVRHENSLLVDVEVIVDSDHAVTVTVSGSEGKAAVPLLHPAGPPDLSSGSGGGLSVLDALASSWGTRRTAGRTAVWFTVRDAEVPARDDPQAQGADQVVAEALSIAAATAAELTADPDVVADRAAITAEQAAVGAAVKTADAARSARNLRAVEATSAADAVAAAAARTVEAVQQQADEVAQEVANAAALAADTVARSIQPGGDAAAARAALQVGAAVVSAAAAKSEETTRAAVVVARAVAEAAEAVAATAAAAAVAVEHEVSDVAEAVQAVAAAAAEQLVTDTFERGAALALVAREAAGASERLRKTNQRLLQAGRDDHRIALALQAAMLTDLPHTDELQLAARYLTAAKESQVGGDWYDAIPLPDRSMTLVIGDVIGHDILAAAVMGQLRNLLRALVWDHDERPSAVGARLDRAMRDLQVNTIASMVVVSVELSPAHTRGASILR